MSISATLLPEFDHEMANTRKILERVPVEKFNWKPHQKSMPLGRLAIHLSEIPSWSKETMTLDQFDIAPKDGPPYQPPSITSRDQLLALFDKNVAAGRQAIAGAKDEDFTQPWSLLGGGTIFFTMPRAGVVRSMIMNHVVHHRAQLQVYLRLLDIPVPGFYGTSADEEGM